MATHKLINVNGNIIVQANNDYPTIDHLPAAVYTLGMTNAGELVFEKERDKFILPTKIYGKNNRYYDVITSDFNNTDGSLGVMLLGLAGSGKTLLTESIANWMLTADRPVFWIKENKIPVALLRAAISIASSSGCLMIFDELGKLYGEHNNENSVGSTQDSLLTLFSDSSFKKVMFMATDNSPNNVNSYLMHRPGRFLYWIKYGKLTDAEVLEYCNDHAVPDDLTQEILYYCAGNDTITYDVLHVVVKTALKTKSVEDFKFRLDILNVPTMTWRKYLLTTVTEANPSDIYQMTVTDLDNFEISLPNDTTISFHANELVEDIGWNNSASQSSSQFKYTTNGRIFTIMSSNSSIKPNDIYSSVLDIPEVTKSQYKSADAYRIQKAQ